MGYFFLLFWQTFGVPVEAVESGEHLLNLPASDSSTVLVVEDCVPPYSDVSHKNHIRYVNQRGTTIWKENGTFGKANFFCATSPTVPWLFFKVISISNQHLNACLKSYRGGQSRPFVYAILIKSIPIFGRPVVVLGIKVKRMLVVFWLVIKMESVKRSLWLLKSLPRQLAEIRVIPILTSSREKAALIKNA